MKKTYLWGGLITLSCVFTSACSMQPMIEESSNEPARSVVSPPLLQPKQVAEKPRLTRPSTPKPISKLEQGRFDVSANKVPAEVFFNSLVDGTDINMLLHPEVTGAISLQLKNVTIKDALTAVRDTQGYDFKETQYGVQILPAIQRTQIFPVNYLNVRRFGRSGMKVSNGTAAQDESSESINAAAGGKTSQRNSSEIETATSSEFWQDLTRTLELMLEDETGSDVYVDTHAGLVIVRAFPLTLARVKNYLEMAELITLRQVLIEAKIVEVALSDGYQSGINWTSLLLDESSETINATLGSESLVNSDAIGGIFSLNFASGSFAGALSLLQTQGDLDVLSSPRIATVNNQKAVIKVGNDEYFVTSVKNTTSTTATGETQSPEIEFTPFFSGVALDVTPQISEDDEITLHIHPTITDVEERLKIIELSGEEYSVPLAFSEVRETDSIIRAKSGEIVVIGGLMQTKTTETLAKVPLLGDIPFLGQLFTQKRQREEQSELVILIQPTIVEQGMSEQEVQALNQKYSRLMDAKAN